MSEPIPTPNPRSEPEPHPCPAPNIGRREAILARCAALEASADRLWWNSALGHAPRSVERLRTVAARLRLRLAGCRTGPERASRIEELCRRYLAGRIDYLEWIEGLRWLGLDAKAGWTRIDPAIIVPSWPPAPRGA